MKMTMHIDDELLARVMEAYGCETKTDAVSFALTEMDRRARLRKYLDEGLGLSREEWADALDPDYDLMAMRVAEGAGKYGKTDAG